MPLLQAAFSFCNQIQNNTTNMTAPVPLFQLLLVFLGGGLGSVCRWGLGFALQPLLPKFPFNTLLANGMACLVLGAVLGLYATGNVSEERKLLLATGFCGGFSTFSTFTAETWQLIQNSHYWAATANVIGSLAVCFVCLLLGLKLTA
jgi:CrcB protein